MVPICGGGSRNRSPCNKKSSIINVSGPNLRQFGRLGPSECEPHETSLLPSNLGARLRVAS